MKTNRTRALTAALSLALLAGTGLISVPVAAAAPAATSSYIVQTRSSAATTEQVGELRHAGSRVGARYSRVLNGFVGELSARQVRALRADPSVASVTRDVRLSISDSQVTSRSQANALAQPAGTWGLDRIDQRGVTRDGLFHYDSTGKGVTAFVIDSGIRISHSQFGGRASHGYDFVDDDTNASDCTNGTGHGTHVAGTLGGSTYGVAKEVKLVSLRVFDCEGNATLSDFISSLEWAVAHKPAGPALINFSGGGPEDEVTEAAVNRTIRAGISVVVAAGNDDINACDDSPAGVAAALTVAASDVNDREAGFSSHGSCVDLFAPGVSVWSAGIASNTATMNMSGTSMAAPHVAGAVAQYLQQEPKASPSQVSATLVQRATRNRLTLADSSPNRLLYTGNTYAPDNVRVVRRGAQPVVPAAVGDQS
jgi:serine protease